MTIYEIFKFEVGGTTYRYTSADHIVTIEGQTYTPVLIERAGHKMGSRGEPQRGTINIEVSYDNPLLRRWDTYPPSGEATVEITEVDNPDSPTLLYTGHVQGVRREGISGFFECAGNLSGTDRRGPMGRYSATCRWALYEDGCYVDPDDATVPSQGFRETFDVIDTDPDEREITLHILPIEADLVHPLPAEFFQGGWVQESDAGDNRIILSSTAGDLVVTDIGEFWEYIITVASWMSEFDTAEELTAFAGCDRSRQTCREKFNNLDNFGGFDQLPRIDKSPFFQGFQR